MKIERIWGGLVSLGMVAALAVPVALANSQATPPPQAAHKEMGMHGGGRCLAMLRSVRNRKRPR